MMNEAIREFSSTKDNNQFDFILTQEGLFIAVTSLSTYRKYTATVNQEFIKNNKNMEFFFENPSEVLTFFEECFTLLKLNSEGAIDFKIDTQVGKSTRSFQFKIETEIHELDHERLTYLKIQKMENEIESFKKECQQLKKILQKQQIEQISIWEQLTQCKKMLMGKDEIINTIFHQLRQINKWREDKESMMDGIARNTKFQRDELNPHDKKFIQIGKRFKKIAGGTWDVLMNKIPISKFQINRFHIKQIRAGSNGSFMYGIGTEYLRGISRAQDHKDFIGYYQNTGFVYQGGEQTKRGAKILDGDTITVQVNPIKLKIRWIVKETIQAETNISPQLHEKDLFLAIIVFNLDSEIQIV